MTHLKAFASLTLLAGMALANAPAALAQDRDLRHDYRRVEQIRADIARDQYRLDRDLRAGRRWAARNDERDLARDRRALEAQLRNIHHDQRDLRRDTYRDSWR